ncbi:MAG: hypothetical protein M0P71_16875 [Melioribacteraceae bacterium]|jgi:hypothetical protein|nr:hypothetical protein [Melioribacteraceae bacterium]
MKAITDKIIEKLQSLIIEPNSEFGKGIQQAINVIEREEKQAEFEEIARIMMKHLGQGEKYHPHYTVIITNSTAELVEGVRSVGHVMDYIPD